ncbi:hypothetical protein D3C85_1554840 [compost metagenome]
MPAFLRSSGQKPKPLAAAWRALRMVTGLPRTRHSPPSLGTMPNISSAVSVRPDPSRPARPTISPGMTSRLNGAMTPRLP